MPTSKGNNYVFNAQWNSQQRMIFAGGATFIGKLGHLQSYVLLQADVGAYFIFNVANAVKYAFG